MTWQAYELIDIGRLDGFGVAVARTAAAARSLLDAQPRFSLRRLLDRFRADHALSIW